jgi:hypothetical protein
MANVDDLLDPLRYNNLSNFELTDVRSIGGGVFAEKNTLEHLRILDLIVKAYQSVHVPTFGHPIPNTSEIHGASITSATDTKVISPSIGEVLKVSALQLTSSEDGTSASIYIYDDTSNTSILYWTSPTLPNGTTITPFAGADGNAPLNIELEIPYGQQLVIKTVSSGSVSLEVRCLTIKTQQ